MTYVNMRAQAEPVARSQSVRTLERRSASHPYAVIRIGTQMRCTSVDQWVITLQIAAMLEAERG